MIRCNLLDLKINCSHEGSFKSHVLNVKNIEAYPHIGNKSRKIFCSKPKLDVIKELRQEEDTELFISDVKKSILDKDISFNYIAPYSYGFQMNKKTVSINNLFEGKYDLTQNCFNVTLGLAKLIDENLHLNESKFNMYISCVSEDAIEIYKCKLNEINNIVDENKLLNFNHAYITFENKEHNIKLILDATTSNFSVKGELFFGTPKELLNLFKSMINKPEGYKFRSNNAIALKVNGYIYDRIGNIDEIAKELMKSWYGEI